MRGFGSLNAWVRGCAKWPTKPLPLWPSIGTTMSITVCPALVIRCFVFLLLIIRLYQPLIPLCDRVVAVKDLRFAPTAAR